jgi:hypothetical protein
MISRPLEYVQYTKYAMKGAVICDVTPCGLCKNGRFGGKYRLHHQGKKIREIGTLAVTSN